MGAIIHHMLDRAPAPVAPFSHAVETDGWVFVTGQIPENPDNEDEPLPVGIEAQTRRVMDNLKLVLSEIGLGLEHVVSARAFLIDMREFETMNKIYASYFPPNKRPARTCIGVTGLAKAARVETQDRLRHRRRVSLCPTHPAAMSLPDHRGRLGGGLLRRSVDFFDQLLDVGARDRRDLELRLLRIGEELRVLHRAHEGVP